MKILYIILFLLFSYSAIAQEILTGLHSNPVVQQKARELSQAKSADQGEDTIPVLLPFHDDFSQGNVFPSPERWIDREAYVNTDFPLLPVNLGAVTLDAINDSGSLYIHAVPGPSTFIADHLTSRYIRLDSAFFPSPRKLTPADSVYLSFYYQPQGRGLALQSTDSLSLQFLIKETYDTIEGGVIVKNEEWEHIWSSKGMSLDTFKITLNNYGFLRVMIPVTDTQYFKKNFRFQFYNHVSLASNSQPSWQSNADPWNIDEVYLNEGRSLGDTVFPEIRFIERPPSMLERYTSMPYKQYSNDPGLEMKDTIAVLVTNRDIQPHISSYRYTVTQPQGSFFAAFQSSPFNLPSYLLTPFGFTERVPVNFNFPISSADSNLYLITHAVKEEAAGSALGDTVETYQSFYNYYSYDDGTPEQGYGLKGINGMLAYRFKLNLSPDTLRAVRIYFNKTLSASNQQFFYLTVWDDIGNKPGDTLYSRLVRVNYSDSLNDFQTYLLENPVRISGTFYIGTTQTTDDNLNIGFDSYNNAQANIMFNVTGTWQNSALNGALMIRPVVGKPLPVGIDEIPAVREGRLMIYPNPARSTINIMIPGYESREKWTITISNMTGMKVFEASYLPTTDISHLQAGLYLITVHKDSGERYSAKLIIHP